MGNPSGLHYMILPYVPLLMLDVVQHKDLMYDNTPIQIGHKLTMLFAFKSFEQNLCDAGLLS